MEKNATLNLRVNPEKKKQVEAILDKLGLSMSAAIELYWNQIIMNNGIPFNLSIPQMPRSVNGDLMTKEEFEKDIFDAVSSYQQHPEKAKSVDEAFKEIREHLRCLNIE